MIARSKDEEFREGIANAYEASIKEATTKEQRTELAKNIREAKRAGHLDAGRTNELLALINKLNGGDEPVQELVEAEEDREEWEKAILELFKSARSLNEQSEELKKEAKELKKKSQEVEEQLKRLILDGSTGFKSRKLF